MKELIQTIKGFAHKLEYVAKIISWLVDSLGRLPDYPDNEEGNRGTNGNNQSA